MIIERKKGYKIVKLKPQYIFILILNIIKYYKIL